MRKTGLGRRPTQRKIVAREYSWEDFAMAHFDRFGALILVSAATVGAAVAQPFKLEAGSSAVVKWNDTFPDPECVAEHGFSVLVIPDVDGDGIEDVLVGCPETELGDSLACSTTRNDGFIAVYNNSGAMLCRRNGFDNDPPPFDMNGSAGPGASTDVAVFDEEILVLAGEPGFSSVDPNPPIGASSDVFKVQGRVLVLVPNVATGTFDVKESWSPPFEYLVDTFGSHPAPQRVGMRVRWIGDIDGIEGPEFVVQATQAITETAPTEYEFGRLYVCSYRPSASLGQRVIVLASRSEGYDHTDQLASPTDFVAADVNGDEATDLVLLVNKPSSIGIVYAVSLPDLDPIPGFRAVALDLENGEITFESCGFGGRQIAITDLDDDGNPEFVLAGSYAGPDIDNANAVIVKSDGTEFLAVAALESPSFFRGNPPPPVAVAATMPFSGTAGDCVRLLVGTGGMSQCLSCTDPQDLQPDALLYERATLATHAFLKPTRLYVREPHLTEPQIIDDHAAFGHAVALGDFNGDEQPDQVIGAPKKDIDSDLVSGDHGRAYGFRFCPGDFDSSGVVDFFDLSYFQDLYSVSDPRADVNCDGDIDFFDFLDAQDMLSAGCP
jgi:hypothetical protein